MRYIQSFNLFQSFTISVLCWWKTSLRLVFTVEHWDESFLLWHSSLKKRRRGSHCSTVRQSAAPSDSHLVGTCWSSLCWGTWHSTCRAWNLCCLHVLLSKYHVSCLMVSSRSNLVDDLMPVFTARCRRWQTQPARWTSLFFSLTNAMTPLCLPVMTFVLSTTRERQLDQLMS